MKIWVTRQSAGSIMFGGLERLNVHFVKPIWLMEEIKQSYRDTPFGYYGDDHGFYKYYGWYTPEKLGLSVLSVGKWIGYSDEDNPERDIAIFIWKALCEHFLNADFREWPDLEKSGKVNIEDFLLEIDLDVRIRNQTQMPGSTREVGMDGNSPGADERKWHT